MFGLLVTTMSNDYRKMIADALSNVIGNAYAKEGAARVAHASIYAEAMMACNGAATTGFPLVLFAATEDFVLSTGPLTSNGPAAMFSRKGTRLSRNFTGVAAAALTDQQPSTEWVPGDLEPEVIQQRVRDLVAGAVQALARSHAMAVKQPTA